MHIDASLSQVLLNEQESLSRQSAASQPNVLITPPPNTQEQEKLAQQAQRTAPKDIVEFQGIEIDLDNIPEGGVGEDTFNIRKLSPREMGDFSLDLYIDGVLSYDEYSMLAFQPEMHPRFEDTIGALTGEHSEPDRPRDYVQEWQERYDFEQRYPSENPKTLNQIDRILGVLKGVENKMDFVA
ncbi:hypothetical protein [Terasakiella sp. SH-1]|uniref:hypothetical protein n=1 Tax=Terasakiella sp. SH-1 TaxID=2560057 RepID=UPI00107446A5|nr:hypothetical protein [Terasakiella sp. SH-1]